MIGEISNIPKPNKTVERFVPKEKKGKAFDIGIGGRDALYMGSLGYDVEAVDIAEKLSGKCNELAISNNLKVRSECKDLRKLEIINSAYEVITSSWILHSLKRSESHSLINKLTAGLVPGGIIIISVFSVDDPYFKFNYNSENAVEENTFYSEEKRAYLHHFSKPEILELFSEFELIYFSDSITLDKGHGVPHYHGIIEYAGKKKLYF